MVDAAAFSPESPQSSVDDTAAVPARVGILVGIARHRSPGAAMEVLERAEVTREHGIAGDGRGTVRWGSTGKRQVTLIDQEDWLAATAEIGVSIPWQERRVNLLVAGLDWPRWAGARLRIGADVLLEITVECDPCRRMDEVAQGLQEALRPGWRGGACSRVVNGGRIAAGDVIRIEQ